MFSLLTSVVAAIAFASAGVSATPVARGTCAPNAQGSGVSIESVQYSGLEWGDHNTTPTNGDVIVSSSFRGLAAPDFHVQQSGQVPTSYIIRDVNNNNLAVTTEGSQLHFTPTSNSGNQANQLFDIACQSCAFDTTPGQAAGSQCTISPHGQNNQCVTSGQHAADPLAVTGCTGSNAQLFNIVF
ncbi:hypothetical protein GYMLUDRAFT_246259 [Collybiopsis luxurians FD-317 M1]|uniref:Ricin B lectin domain-containing protein n=1 Tax=Collybiopsis luxurians FD-317 M1 TaxID=944289 RepID=A0A0D0CRI2_9AGAR|nr:hypothetical protein GYMLUDRAFT_246259 [Collybiopsis luxurians FD-317 M1]